MVADFDNGGYFGAASGDTTRRLKLDMVSIYRDDTSDAKVYSFVYDRPGDVPDRKSSAVDLWGYYNGQDTNNHLVPNPNLDYSDIANYFPDISSISYTLYPGQTQSNRMPNFVETKVGTLTSIEFPTGGKSTYQYEQHRDNNEKIVGGLRLRKVTNQTNDPVSGENQVLDSYYFYGDLAALAPAGIPPNDPDDLPSSSDYISSGITQQDLNFSQKKLVDGYSQTPCHKTKRYLTTFNRAVAVPFNITYSTVIKLQFNSTTSGFEGCSVTDFYNGVYDNAAGNVSDEKQPFFNQNLEYGEVEYQRMYDKDLTLLQETQNNYLTVPLSTSQTSIPEKVGLILFQNQTGTIYKGGSPGCKRIYQNGSVYTYYNYFTTLAGDCTQSGSSVISGGVYSHFYSVPSYGYKQYWKKMISSTTTVYEGAEDQSTTTTYSYGSADNTTDYHFFATEIITTDSKGKKIKSEIIYPSDKADLPDYPSVDDTELLAMKTRNQLGVPIYVKKSYEDGVGTGSFDVISQQRRIMDDVTPSGHPAGFLMIMPSKVQVAKGTASLEDRMLYHSYDKYGNLIEVSYPNYGMHYINVWGYKGDYLIAEIQNSSYAGMPTVVSDAITAIQDDSDVENTQSEENALLSDLNALRNQTYFVNSQLSVYVYDPGIGVTQTSNVRGYTTYYFYDQHNRLDYATDEAGKVLTKNEYNLRINN